MNRKTVYWTGVGLIARDILCDRFRSPCCCALFVAKANWENTSCLGGVAAKSHSPFLLPLQRIECGSEEYSVGCIAIGLWIQVVVEDRLFLSISSYLQYGGVFSEAELCDVVCCCLLGLRVLHSQGIQHGVICMGVRDRIECEFGSYLSRFRWSCGSVNIGTRKQFAICRR